MVDIKDGTACGHRACLSHKTYPCPFCGRIAGRALTTSERVAKAMLDTFPVSGGRTEEEWFAACVDLIEPILDFRSVRRIVYAESDTSLINTEEEAKRLCELAIADDLGTNISGFSSSAAKSSRPITLLLEPRPWLSITDAIKHPELHENSDGGYLIPGDVYHDPIYTPLWPNWFGRLLLRWFRIRDKSKDTTMEKILMGPNKIVGRAMEQTMK